MEEKKSTGLLFKFGILFLIFTVITLILCGTSIYFTQDAAYRAQRERDVKRISAYLEDLMMADGKRFAWMQEYFMAHMDEMMIPHNFSGDYQPEKTAFETLFAARHPGRVLGQTIDFDEMAPEVQMAYALYIYEYWLNTFEKARDDFGLEYVYYVVPIDEPLYMVYMIDAVREKKEVGGMTYISLGENVYEPYEEHRKMWEAWDTGKKPVGYDTYDNEFGQTYAYYIPLWIDGRKMGVISIDIAIESVNRGILLNTARQVAGIGAILAACVGCLLWFIHRRYIAKLTRLQQSVQSYAQRKDANIAGDIERGAGRGDEIASLSMQVAAMILELENYMKSLVTATKELTDTKEHAARMNELAHKDALTGVRNKAAYDNEVNRLTWEIDDGLSEFGIAMIDLNFLKRINDTYGHQQGNIAIKKLCHMICVVFAHSPVFRIGGDEFVVILRDQDYQNIEALLTEFNRKLAEMAADVSLEPWERISAALGFALYDAAIDSGVENVFKRADKAMYARKKAMKAIRLQ